MLKFQRDPLLKKKIYNEIKFGGVFFGGTDKGTQPRKDFFKLCF